MSDQASSGYGMTNVCCQIANKTLFVGTQLVENRRRTDAVHFRDRNNFETVISPSSEGSKMNVFRAPGKPLNGDQFVRAVGRRRGIFRIKKSNRDHKAHQRKHECMAATQTQALRSNTAAFKRKITDLTKNTHGAMHVLGLIKRSARWLCHCFQRDLVLTGTAKNYADDRELRVVAAVNNLRIAKTFCATGKLYTECL